MNRNEEFRRVLFAVNAYSNLKAGSKDVINVFQVFTEESIGNCDKGLSEPIHSCENKHEFSIKLGHFLKQWMPTDQLIFYYSGHGVEKAGKFYFEFGVDQDKTIYPFNNLINEMDAHDVTRAIFIIDACFSGNTTKNSSNRYSNFESLSLPKGKAIISSSSPIEESYEEADGSGSIFTNLFCEGLRTGLRNKKTADGYIGIPDIMNFVKEELISSKYSSYKQNPRFKVVNADKPIWIAKNISGKIREHSSKIITDYTELKLLYERTNRLELPCERASVERLDWDLIKLLFESELSDEDIDFDRLDRATLLQEIGLFSNIPVNGKNRLHKSAVLCFHKQPERYYPSLKSKFTTLSLKDKAVQLEKEVRGPLSYQIERFRILLEDKLKFTYFDASGGRKNSSYREEDAEIIREVISNAFVHRDYDESTPIQVGLFPDYIEVKSPGLFPEDLKWNRLLDEDRILSKPKNGLISYYLSSLLKYEGVGRGFSIIRKYRQNSVDRTIDFIELPGKITAIRILMPCIQEYYEVSVNNSENPFRNYDSKFGENLEIITSNIQSAKSYHDKTIANWASAIAFADLKTGKNVEDINVIPRIKPATNSFNSEDNINQSTYNIDEVLNDSPTHILLLGNAGSGKTTVLKSIIGKFLTKDEKINKKYNRVILIRSREITDANNINNFMLFDQFLEVLGVSFVRNNLDKISSFSDFQSSEILLAKKKLFEFIDMQRALLLIDGLDEMPSSVRGIVLKNVEEVGQMLEKCRIIMTSRPGAFQKSIINFSTYELLQLDLSQISSLSSKWFNSVETSLSFTENLKEHPYLFESMKSPLMAVHILSIYERYHTLPKRPRALYRKLVYLFLEEWDLQRSIYRDSSYSNFTIDRKFDFLTHISYYLSTNKNYTFSRSELEQIYNDISESFSLPAGQAKTVINEIISTTGLIYRNGYDSFSFTFRSVQEYLCAEYLIRLTALDEDKIIMLPSELAIATGLSQSPEIFFSYIIFELDLCVYNLSSIYQFLEHYTKRISFEKPDFSKTSQELIIALAYINSIFLLANDKYFEDKDSYHLNMTNDENVESVIKKFYDLKNINDLNMLELTFSVNLVKENDKVFILKNKLPEIKVKPPKFLIIRN